MNNVTMTVTETMTEDEVQDKTEDAMQEKMEENAEMNLEDRIAVDLKSAMIAKDALRVSVLRSLKSAFTYARVAPRTTSTSSTSGANGDYQLLESSADGRLPEAVILTLVAKEAKKRQESADSYVTAGQPDRADVELVEKRIIEQYLPAALTEEEVRGIVDDEVAKLAEISPSSSKAMGIVIATVKSKVGPTANGGLIAKLVKEKLSQ